MSNSKPESLVHVTSRIRQLSEALARFNRESSASSQDAGIAILDSCAAACVAQVSNRPGSVVFTIFNSR
jgi:hypothetical protein